MLPWKFQKTPTKMVAKEKGQDKKKNSSDPTEKALDTVAPQLGQTVDPVVSKTKAQDRGFLLLLFLMFFVVVFIFKECIKLSLLSMMVFFFFKVCIMGFTIVVYWYIIILLCT